MFSPFAVRPRIRELRLRNFRSFADARLPLDDFTILVGRNGAGKSNILDAFDFLRDALRNTLRTAVERRESFEEMLHRKAANRIQPTDNQIDIGVVMELPAPFSLQVVYGFSLKQRPQSFEVAREELQTYPKRSFSFTRRDGAFSATSLPEAVKPVVDSKGLLLPLLAGQDPIWSAVHEFLRDMGVYDLSPHVMKLEPPIGNEPVLEKEGRNIGDVIQALSDDTHAHQDLDEEQDATTDRMGWIMSHLRAVVRDVVSVHAFPRAGRRALSFRFSLGDDEEGHPQSASFWNSQVSNGTLRSLGVLVALRQPQTPSLILLDEIESSVHPRAVAALMEAATATSKELGQVVLSTHDPDALSHESVRWENVRVVDCDSGVSSIFLLKETVRKLLEEPPESVGRLLRANALWHAQDPCILREDGVFAEPA